MGGGKFLTTDNRTVIFDLLLAQFTNSALIMGLLKKLFGTKQEIAKASLVDYNKYFDSEIIDEIPIELLNLGTLNLPTGELIACDPLGFLYNAKPFTKKVTPGVYSVIACIAKTKDWGDRHAAVKLQFSPARASKWEMALINGQNVETLKHEDEYFGFGVDAGLGCFCDLRTQTFYKQWDDDFMKKNTGANLYDDFFAEEFKKNAKAPDDINDVGDWLNFQIPNTPELNIIMFSSGFGDGVYPCYWGITESGDICSLMIDFQVFDTDFK